MTLERPAESRNDAGTLLQWDGAPSEVQSCGPAFHARTYLVRDAFRRLRPRSVLDIGCGRGHVTAVAAPYADSVFAVDLAPDAVAETRRRLASHADAHVATANVLTGEWGEIQPPAGGFGAILLSEVLEHLDDDAGMLRCARRLLAERGYLVITVPAHPSLWTQWDDMAGHIRRYTKRELLSKVTAAGFEVRSFRSWGFPLSGWLAIRGAKMRGRRVAEHTGSEVPSLLAKAMPLAATVFRPLARVESVFSNLDRGAGYVVVARARASDAISTGEDRRAAA